MQVDFEGQTAVITGGARGIGFATAKTLARRGAHIVLVDSGVESQGWQPDPSVVGQAVEEISAIGGEALGLSLDLADPTGPDESVKTALERFGRLDAVIHLAGVSAPSPIEKVDDVTLERLVAVNATAAFRLCRAAYPVMRAQADGRIVLTTSGHALTYDPDGPGDLSLYALGKGAQYGLAVSLAEDGHHHGIMINVISPVAKTRMYRSSGAASLTPERIAGVVAWLASRECRVSGFLLRTAGGSISQGQMTAIPIADLHGSAENPDAVASAMAAYLSGP